ncbi:MAG TPA: LacI family transcriptional regulator [Candidatus Mediterraneibacter pullistercoris]|nr:LacI family transcriptional regulator [Candidatus Mediterraneibacter pullistercoris]
MGKSKVTSSDVAKRAGVSQATVSMVLNKKYNVSFSKEVIQRVEDAAEELGYELPRRKKKKEERRENLLVVISPNLTNPYYVMLLQGIESRAAEQGFGIFVCNTQRDLKIEERYLKMISSLNPQGIIYMCNPSQCFMDQVEELSERIPVVVVNNQNERLSVDAVELDNSKLGRLMARHLLELGHRDVGYVAPPLTVRQKQRSKRVEGFLKEFQNVGLKDHVIIKAADEQIDKDIPGIDSEYRIGYDLTKELLREHRELTAIVGLNDMIAFGIMDALYDEKYKVPGDMSVMGCDNTLFAKVKEVSLTTIEHFVIYKGMDACDIIMKKIGSRVKKYTEIEPVSIYHVEYEPKIVVRGTTSYPRTEKRKINKKCKNINNKV